MIQFIRTNALILIGIIAGSLAGWLYWYYVGCSSGQCPITSKPLNSSIYGALMGAILFSMFKNQNQKSDK